MGIAILYKYCSRKGKAALHRILLLYQNLMRESYVREDVYIV